MPSPQSLLPDERHQHAGHGGDRYANDDAPPPAPKTWRLGEEETARAEAANEAKRQQRSILRSKHVGPVGRRDARASFVRAGAEQCLAERRRRANGGSATCVTA